MEEGLASIITVSWPRQEGLPLTLTVKPFANSSYNSTLFTTSAEKGKKTLGGLLRGHQGTAEVPMPVSAGAPMEGARMGNNKSRIASDALLLRFLTTHT